MAKLTGLVLLMCCLAHAQTPDSQARFEVASVKVAPPPDPRGWMNFCGGGPGSKTPGRYRCENAVLATLLVDAYSLKWYQIPESAKSDSIKYNIEATLPEGAARDQIQFMMQNLLADRFKLVFHFDKKEIRAFDLTVAKSGSKLKEATPGPPPPPLTKVTRDSDGFPITQNGPGTYMTVAVPRTRIVGTYASLERMVAMLTAQLGGPITDSTGLTGKYDFVLTYAMIGASPLAAGDAAEPTPSVFEALPLQLGLKLEPKKVSVDVIVIDSVLKTPIEN